MPTTLTDTAIAKTARELKAGRVRRDMTDAGLPGLRLRLTARGSATWVLACRDRAGRMRRFRLGAYPAIGISAARDAARTMREDVRKGADPIADARRERDREKVASAGVGTLDELLTRFGASPAAPRTWPTSSRVVALVFRRLMSRPVAALTVADFQLAADGYPSAQTASLAVRCIRPVLKWAAHPGRA